MYTYVAIKFVCVCVCVHAWACIRSCKACKRIYVIRNLKRSGCDAQSIMRVYRQTIQSLLVYGHPCCCNMSQSVSKHLWKSKDGSWRWFSMATRRVQKISWRFLMLMKDLVSTFFTVCSTAAIILCELFFLHTAAYSSQQVYFKEAQMSDRAFQKLFYQVLLGTTIPDS